MKWFFVIPAIAALMAGSPRCRADDIPAPPKEVVKLQERVEALSNDRKRIEIVPELRTNVNPGVRLVVQDQCVEEGEFGLSQLARFGAVEESYVLIPELCLWVEVGNLKRRDGTRLDSAMIAALVAQFGDLVIYHTHVGEELQVESVLPTYKDLMTLVLINAELVWKVGARVAHRIATGYGVVEYGFSDDRLVIESMDRYRYSGLIGFEAQNLVFELMTSVARSSYQVLVDQCRTTAGSVPYKLSRCMPIRTGMFTVRFRSHAFAGG